MDVVQNAQECLVVVGSRSSEISYLQEIERAIQDKLRLVHYRILLGPPHGQVLKDHLLRLLALRPARANGGSDAEQTLHISILNDLTPYPERFFVASEQVAVIILPSANSPMNFDTGPSSFANSSMFTGFCSTVKRSTAKIASKRLRL
jgi:hypothetical protein